MWLLNSSANMHLIHTRLSWCCFWTVHCTTGHTFLPLLCNTPAANLPGLLLLVQLKGLLDGAEAEAAGSSEAAAAEEPAGAEQVAEQVEQLQVAEVGRQLLYKAAISDNNCDC